MQTEGIRVPGLNQDLSREITKFDSSEFDVSTKHAYLEIQLINMSILPDFFSKNSIYRFISSNYTLFTPLG